jgi:mannosyltransferase OCH1-like enzyme
MNDFPRIIHQIWLQGYSNISEKYKGNMQQNRHLNPNWKYIFWDDTKIINLLREYDEWISTYYRLEYLHHKVDFARYIILYKFGGAYIDMDAIIIKPLDNIINRFGDYDLIVSKVNSNMIENYFHCRHPECINNGIIIAKPRNIVLEKMIKSIIKNPKCDSLSTKITCIQSVTGPSKFTKVIYKNINNKVKILDAEYLEPCVLDVCDVTDNTHVIHKHAGSWYSANLKYLVSLYLKNKWLVYICCLIIIIILIYNYF